MSAKKSKPAPSSGLFSMLVSMISRGRWFVVAALFLVVAAVGWRLAWNRVRGHVLTDRDYQLSPRDIVLSPLPPWIHTDLKTEVIRDASLDASLSILDEDLTKRLANAFSLHPWIARVNRVSKHHPARVEVDLLYRQPVAMVEVSGGLLPIDGEGTLLPSEDFSPAEAKKYPRVARIQTHPIGPVGTNWGDVSVAGAAQIAKLLDDRWLKLKLYRVLAPVRGGSHDVDGYTYELLTHAGTRIIWGRPPGSEPTGELPALDKIALLERVVVEDGSLDGRGGPRLIDLRTGVASGTPRTAVKQAP